MITLKPRFTQNPGFSGYPLRKSRQPASSFCLAAANSSSLNTPAVCNCANCCN